MDDESFQMAAEIAGIEGGELLVFCGNLILQGDMQPEDSVDLYRKARAYVRACEAAEPKLKET